MAGEVSPTTLTDEEYTKMAIPRMTPGAGGALRTVFVKCAALVALNTIIVAVVLAFQSERLNMQLARHGVVDLAERTVEVKAATLVQPLRFNVVPQIEAVAEEAIASTGAAGRASVVLNREGEILAAPGEASLSQGALAALAREALETGSEARGDSGLLVARPVMTDDGTMVGAVAIGLSDEAAQAAIAGDRMTIRLVAGAVMLVMLGVTLFCLRRMLMLPLRGLSRSIRTVAQGDYETEVAMQERNDEIGAIARNLGQLVEALAQGRESERLRGEQHAAQAEVVHHLSKGLDALAEGVLTHKLHQEFPEDYETLRRNYNRALDSLRAAIAAVKEGAESIHSGADEIGRASEDLARRTETQAATLEESAAALDQLLNMVKEAADGAKEVDKSVGNASELARRNGTVMSQAVTAMSKIEDSAEQIGQIISVIDDIAFQTNLLALNAGVEAARAGSSGKGFAVVASEVRALAQRSSDAAQQIKGLVGTSTAHIKDGAHLVQRAGEALHEVVSSVESISRHVSQIAASAGEQAQGLNEINVGVTNLDRVTQQNAAMVEEATAAAQMLRTDAGNMIRLMGKFDVAERPADAGAARAA